MPRLKGIFILHSNVYGEIYGPEEHSAIGELIDVVSPPQTAEDILAHPELLREVDVILSSWGAPLMDEAFLAHAPHLRVTLTPHIAGSLGMERRRLGELMLAELRRFVVGEPLQHAITRERACLMATP